VVEKRGLPSHFAGASGCLPFLQARIIANLNFNPKVVSKNFPTPSYRAQAEASLTSFGTAHREVFPRHASLFVFPRRVSAEGPLGLRSGRQKKGSGRQKKERYGATKKRRLGATASHCVFPRRVSAEGPLASLGVTKK
jgi:hypothetical protein